MYFLVHLSPVVVAGGFFLFVRHLNHFRGEVTGQEKRGMFGFRKLCLARWLFLLGLAAAVLLGLSSNASAAYWGTPSEVPDALPWTLLAIVGAFGLYALRCWRPIVYGFIELIAAVFIIYFSIAPAKQSATTVCNGKALWGLGCYFQSFVIILAGIYIFVRGLDNMQARRLLCVMQEWRRKRRAASPE
jgi:hypothetical protein